MKTVDYLIIGGGFYGCSLALFLRSITDDVLIIEAGDSPMNRASRVNQARVHTGFHYPRSVLTAVKSMALHKRFANDFPSAVVNDFKMLYAIARRRSRISPQRFHRMYLDMGAPISPANASERALFDPATIEAVFACTEFAFDHSKLRAHITSRLAEHQVELLLSTRAESISEAANHVVVRLSNGQEVGARHVFNVSYAQVNNVLRASHLPQANLKYELSEIALMRAPEQLSRYGFTIMDGPFLSMMPYPSDGLHSLTHVRYTPHSSWTDRTTHQSPYAIFENSALESKHRYMMLDGVRYVPSLADAEWVRSIYDVKTVLLKNEADDGRPILYQQLPYGSRVTSILGGKIDNIYDLFDVVRMSRPECADAHAGLVVSGHNTVAAPV